jgi:hypothetical protein
MLSILEVLVWSWWNCPTFELVDRSPPFEDFFRSQPGDFRTVNPARIYNAMSVHAREIGGYDPCVTLRYAEFMAFTQGQDPDQATAYLSFSGYHPLYRMLRCRYAIIPQDKEMRLTEFQDILPQLLLVQDYSVINQRDEIFKALAHTDFDPKSKVILEQAPQPAPVKSEARGTVWIVNSSTDHLTVEADLPSPAILLITDGYSEGWRAVALPGSVQQEYRLLPANYVLRAVPLAAGKHRLRIEYSPAAFRIGAYVSILSLACYFTLLTWHVSRLHHRKNHPDKQPAVGKRSRAARIPRNRRRS